MVNAQLFSLLIYDLSKILTHMGQSIQEWTK